MSTLELLFALRDLTVPTTAAQRSVLISILMHRRQDGTVRASIDQLARAMSLSRRTVLRVIPELERAGLVEVRRGRQHQPSAYVLTIQRCHRGTSDVHPAVPSVHPAVPSVQLSGDSMAPSEDLSGDLSDPLERIVAAYIATFREVAEQDPVIDGRERGHARGLLRRVGGSPARAIDVIQRAMRGRPPYFELGAIAARVNDVLARAEPSSRRHIRPIDLDAERADELAARAQVRGQQKPSERLERAVAAAGLLRAVGGQRA